MRNHQLLFRITILISVLLYGCGKDFLNVPTNGVLIRQDYVKDISTTKEYLNGVYTRLPGILATYSVIYGDLISDNLKPVAGSNMLLAHYNWTQQADNKNAIDLNINFISYNAYNVILGCNFVIEKADEFKSENETVARQLKGQALALRALLHFHLVNHFAQPYKFTAQASHPGIVYVTSSDWRPSSNTRNTVADVYARIVADLQASIEMLSPSERNTFYINFYAAKALLARVNLYSNHYRESIALAREVINAVPLMTVNYPQKLFTLQETEALFQFPQNEQIPITFPSFYLRGSILFLCSSDIVNTLNEQPTDLRRLWMKSTANGWTVTKYPEGIIPNIPTPSNSYYHTILRSSEMYLTAAEAYTQLNNADSAHFFLDIIKKRAIPNAQPTTALGTALLDSVYKERRKEFAFEGHRMLDLLRWGKSVKRDDALNSQAKELSYPNDKAIAPIPTYDVDLTGLKQNPGYN